MTQVPELKVFLLPEYPPKSRVDGWDTLNEWATHNNTVWNASLKYCDLCYVSELDRLKIIAQNLLNHNIHLSEQLNNAAPSASLILEPKDLFGSLPSGYQPTMTTDVVKDLIEQEQDTELRTMSDIDPVFAAALSALYSKYCDNPTQTQKINILINELGACNIHYMGMYKDSDEVRDRYKLQLMEFEYLEAIGLLLPEYC